MQYARDNKLLTEAHYGGAFDIRDDQYFTKEDLMEFAEDVVDSLNTLGYNKAKLESIFLENNVIEITVSWDGNEVTVEQPVDMRRIRKPKDLDKYRFSIISKMKSELKELGFDFGPHYGDYELEEDCYKDINEGCGKPLDQCTCEVDDEDKVNEDLTESESLNDSIAVKMSRDDFARMCREGSILKGLSDRDYTEIKDSFYIGYENFDAEGQEFTWVRRHGDVEHLDFDNWAVWEAYCHDDAETYYFIVDEDTGFIDWGPVDTLEEAQEFLASKVSDWEDLDESCKSNTIKSKLTESALDINQGDLVDFGTYGKLYVCNPNYHDDYYWVTDEEESRMDKHASGWSIAKDLAERVIESAFDEEEKETYIL